MKKLNNVRLWLDDLRNPFLDIESKVPKEFLDGDLVWVRSFEELSLFVEKYGLPSAISFDHDLGDSHYTPEKYWSNYPVSKLWQDLQVHTEKTGLDCVKHVVNLLLDYNLDASDFPTMYFHSANPVGNDNMMNLWGNFVKFKDSL